jgi:hypothetical protein
MTSADLAHMSDSDPPEADLRNDQTRTMDFLRLIGDAAGEVLSEVGGEFT